MPPMRVKSEFVWKLFGALPPSPNQGTSSWLGALLCPESLHSLGGTADELLLLAAAFCTLLTSRQSAAVQKERSVLSCPRLCDDELACLSCE